MNLFKDWIIYADQEDGIELRLCQQFEQDSYIVYFIDL